MIRILLCALLCTLSPNPAAAQRVFPRQEAPPTSFNAPMANSPLLFSDFVKATIISQNPLFANDSPEHKARNRRTEFDVEEQDGKKPDGYTEPCAPNPAHNK